jgi:hypothetical protein
VVQEGVWGPCLNLENVDEGILSFDVGKVRMMESRKMISDWSKYSVSPSCISLSHRRARLSRLYQTSNV